MNARGCPTLSSSPAVGRGASFALAPDRRVGSVLHRRPPVPPTRGRGTFTAGSRHERAEEERTGRVMSVRQPRVGGGWWIGCDDASALLPGINAASTGAFAFTDVDMNTWVATTLSIVDLSVHYRRQHQPPRLSAEGSERLRESHRWKASGSALQYQVLVW